MTDRRGFLATLVGAGGALAPVGGRRLRPGAPQVEATATVFYAPPDGENTLVRFSVSGTDAPAGRLRVYDRRQRLLGTAGVISVGSTLYGELWLRVEDGMAVLTHLEIPGRRGVVRSEHHLRERPRWTLYLVTLADARELSRDLSRVPLQLEGARAAALLRAGVRGNVLAATEAPEHLDHVEFLSLCESARSVGNPYGLFAGTIVLDRQGIADRVSTTGLMLAGSGVRYLVRRLPSGMGFEWIPSPDGSRILQASVGPSATPGSLGFGDDVNEMARRVERWLTSEPALLSPTYPSRGALVLGEHAAEMTAAVRRSLAAWNERYAYPRILLGDAESLLQGIATQYGPDISVRPQGTRDLEVTSLPALTRFSNARAEQRRGRTQAAVALLADRLSSTSAQGLDAVAAQFAFPVPATLFFNTSPFPRTDVAVAPGGSRRIVTDVPALGYVCLPRDHRPERPEAASATGVSVMDGRYFRLALDDRTGAVRSLTNRFDRTELVRPDSNGVIHIDGARLEAVEKQWLPGIGIQLVAERSSPRGGVRSTLTLYDDLPWIDVTVEARASGQSAMEYGFAFAVENPDVAWEVPAGTDGGPAPIPALTHLRWIRLASQERTVLVRGLDAPQAAVRTDGTLISFAPRGRSRYRIAIARTGAFDADPWRFGWSAEPLVSAPVPGDGPAALPSFGSLLIVDQPGVVVLGLRTADPSNNATLYLQEVLGVARDATVGMGVLGFRAASLVDFRDRVLAELPLIRGRGVVVPLRARGVAAVRLHDVTLAVE